MRLLAGALFIAGSVFAAAMVDPFLVSSKAQGDLESALARLIPAEQFLVQVNTDVATRVERKIIDGEIVVPPPAEPTPRPMIPMPGFVPETDDPPTALPLPATKQAYRMVEVPELKAVRVSVHFDDSLPEITTTRAKNMVRTYLQNNYPGIGMLAFSTMPMLKPAKETPREPAAVPEKEKEKKEEKPPLSEVDVLWNYTRWAAMALLVVIAALLLSSRGRQQPQISLPRAPYEMDPRSRSGRPAARDVFAGDDPPSLSKAAKKPDAKTEAALTATRRKKMLERFLARSQAFRQYFGTLSVEASGELYSCLKGQAFDKLLEGLAMAQPRGDKRTPTNIDEILEQHSKEFDDFVHAKDWEDRQFFGFLHSLTDDQLASLVAGEPAEIACVLLRMMQPKQSAAVLGMMAAAKRSEILSQAKSLQNISFSDLVAIERDVRQAAQRLPDRFFGSEKEDVTFWGTVVSESTDQDTLVEDLVRARPEIEGQLKKFKFRLEEAASLPDSLLERVLNQVDNEELCLALATCSKDVREVIMDVLPDMRRQVISELLPSYKNARKERTVPARMKLTRRIREAMG